MSITELNSRSNEKIKYAAKIASSSKFRYENNAFFLQGVRLCYDAFLSKTPINQLFFTENARDKNPEKIESLVSCAKQTYRINDSIASLLSETKNNQGVFAVCEIPNIKINRLKDSGKYIALENIQDPANLGAITRTAEALGIDGAVIANCCDPYNPKAQRAAMGSLLRLPLIFADDLPSFILENSSYLFLASTPDSSAEKITETPFSEKVVAIIGNEGNGISAETLSLCKKVTIPMLGRAESLNASMAAAILMWEMVREK